VVLQGVGHALFVDDAPRFNALVRDFIGRRVWP
jgi:pimeloyl-ACP methyl ester carboxylesterase